MSDPIKLAAALAVSVLLLGAMPAAAADDEPKSKTERAEELAREGAERLMSTLETLLRAIPQYGMPRIEENGDIVIPRLDKPEEERVQPDAPEPHGPGPDAPEPEDEIVIEET